MYLSRIELNAKRRTTMKALAMPQLLHGAIESGFPGERRRNLWRIDWLNNHCYLLVLSDTKPDLTGVADQFGFPNVEPLWETKNYDSLLEQIAAGQVWGFRLRANPVHAVKDKGAPGRGRLFAHVTPEQQKTWLLARSEKLGFSLEDNAFEVVHTEWKKFRKGQDGGREVSLRTASFEGVLTVTDAELFREALTKGVGRGKAYGLGMLTVIKPHSIKVQNDNNPRN